MTETIHIIATVDGRLTALLGQARGALRGETLFKVEDVRRLQMLVGEMAAVVPQFSELRRLYPENSAEIDLYKSQLTELVATLRGIRLMLLAQRAQLDVQRGQLAAVNQWATAFQQTRPATRRDTTTPRQHKL